MRTLITYRFTLTLEDRQCAYDARGLGTYVYVRPEVRDWLLKNAPGSKIVENWGCAHIDIDDHNAALMFKMRWG